jgi:hypothetical protein
MIGEPFTLVLSPQGDVQKVEGMDSIIRKMLERLPRVRGRPL